MTEHTHPGRGPRGTARPLAIARAGHAAIQPGGSGHDAAAPNFFEVI
jgi:hypothetical protein